MYKNYFSFPVLFVALLYETTSFIWFAGLLCLCTTMVSCMGTAPMKEVRLIDSLNQVAYAFRYKTWIHPAMRHQGPTVKSASINKEKRKHPIIWLLCFYAHGF